MYPVQRFAGKVALVTGASSGIGEACAARLAEEGARVFSLQRGASDFETVKTDLSDPASVVQAMETVLAKTQKIDVLVNNAGFMAEAPVEETELAMWQRTLAINLTAPFLLIKQAAAFMTGGAIVNVGSIEGLAANPGHVAYCASKAGLHGLTRAVAIDLGPKGIRCNAVAPGWIDTPLNLEFVASQPRPKAFGEEIKTLHPVGRSGKPDDVAALVAWLASGEASFVTGQVYTIDGGRMTKISLP